jgi:hypothetical protein
MTRPNSGANATHRSLEGLVLNAVQLTSRATRLAGCCLAILSVGLSGVSAVAGTIEFVVNRVDGAVFIKNSGVTPSVIDGYTIFSPSDALIVAGWTPIAGNYDFSGDQSVDSISTGSSSARPTPRR